MSKILFTAIIFIITLLGISIFIWPKYQQLQNLKTQERMYENQLRGQRSYALNLQEISQKLNAHPEALKKIDTALPDFPKIASLLNFLARASQDNGLLLNEIGSVSVRPIFREGEREQRQPQEESRERKRLKEIRFSIKLLGDYPSLKNFLSRLEKSARLIEVERIFFTSTPTGIFKYELGLKVHSY